MSEPKRKLGAAEARALKADVLEHSRRLGAPRGFPYYGGRSGKAGPQFHGGDLYYRLFYTSCGRYVVGRLLLVHQEILQFWYNPQGFIVTVTLPSPLLAQRGVAQCAGPVAGNPRRSLPELLNYINFRPNDVIILEDPVLQARGIRKDIEKNNGWIGPIRFIHRLFNDNKFETLRKCGLAPNLLATYHYDDIANKWYKQTLAMLNARKHYNMTTFLDYLRMLKDAGKDINNPAVYLPDDLDYAHAQLVAARNRHIDKQRRKQRLEQDKADFLNLTDEQKQLYADKMRRFKDIILRDNTFCVTPLPTIEDHYKDTVTLHHCLFHNRYFEKNDTIVLRVTRNGMPDKPYADAEVNFRTGELLQLYGNWNVLLPKPQHDTVSALIKDNMRRFVNAGRRSTAARRPALALDTFRPAFA